jgi:hypothetical protein
MNSWQLFVAAGAPTIAALIGILLNERRADRTDVRIHSVESTLTSRINGVESTLTARINGIESTLTARIDNVESGIAARMDQSETRLGARIDRISDDLKVFYRDLGRHDADIANLKQR